MAPEDAQAIDSEFPIQTDLCIIGSGPAGWTIAEELQESKLRILALESGGLTRDPDSDDLNQIENVGVPLFNGRNRILGGTSHEWSGRCLPFDEIDYEARPWVPFSGWPFGAETMAPYVNRAHKHLNIKPEASDSPGPEPAGMMQPNFDPDKLRIVRYRFSMISQTPKISCASAHASSPAGTRTFVSLCMQRLRTSILIH